MRLNPTGSAPRNGVSKPSWARLSVGLVSGLAVLAAAGCGSSGGAASGTVSATITIAAVPGIDDAPLQIAKKEGLFTAAGLQHVVIKTESQDSAVFTALQSKQAQIAATDYGDFFYQQSLHSSYEILADGYDATPGSLEVVTLPGSGITSPAQLEGAKVGVPNDDVLRNIQPGSGIPDSLETAAATNVLSDFVGNLNTVDWVPMDPGAEVTALQDRSVKAILVSQPYIAEADLKGAVEIIDACSGYTANLPLSGYVTTSVWAKDNPAAVADFQSAMAKAQDEAAMSGFVQSMLPSFAGISVQDADLASIGTYPTSTSVTALERVSRLLWSTGMIDASQPVAIPLATGK
jgi:NitT/TauT family transport system substrate-binding protein